MIAFNGSVSGAEQEEGSGTVRALGLPLCQTFVPNQSALLITDKSTDRNTCESTMGYMSINFRRRHEFWEDGVSEAEEIKKRLFPFERSRV